MTPPTPEPDFKHVWECSPAAALLLSPDLIIVAASESYLRATLTARDQLVDSHMFDAFPDDPDDPDATGVATLRASLHRVLTDRVPDTMAVQKYDIRLPAADGGGFVERYWSPVNSPILDDSGDVAFIVHQVMDVTDFVRHRLAGDEAQQRANARTTEMEEEIFLRAQEIQRTNALLRASEERFRLLSQATSDAIWEWDLVTGAVWVSESFERLAGHDSGHITSWDAWSALVHPDDRPHVLAGQAEAISSDAEGWAIEYRLVQPSGSIVWAESRATIIRDDEGRAVRIVGGTRDLTVRKEAELRIRRQAELLDRASDAIIVRDLDDRITYWNAGAERVYGWSSAEAIGREDPDLRSHDPDVFATARATTIRTGEWAGEFTHATKDGREVIVEARWTLLRDGRGEPEGVLVINTDVTERRHLASQYLRSQRLESIGTLAGGIAHDLNNVLTPILMAANLLRGEVRSQQGTEWLELMEASADRGADMVRQVLTFARGVEGRMEPLDLAEIARDLVRLISDSFPKSIRISCEASDDRHVVTGDATQLHQVLLNLCVNARDAMPAGGDLTIFVDTVTIDEQYSAMTLDAEPGEYVVVRVSDSGVGIQTADMERIFDPFFTTKDVGQGTGLGLSTSHAITRNHGGFLNAYSEVGRGSTFNLYVPAAPTAAVSAVVSAPEISGAQPGETILVVEDEPMVMAVTKHTLEGAGYRVLTATDGADGIATYTMRRAEIDLVLSDMMMPIMDGAALTTALRRVDPDVRVIVASGLTRNADASASIVENADFLAKPFTAEALLTAVRRCLDDSTRGHRHGHGDGSP